MEAAFVPRRARTAASAFALLLLVGCLSAASAHAASTISITVGADPVESIATQLGATGSVSDPDQYLVIHYKPTGGSACGANPGADDGQHLIDSANLATGAYAKSANVTFDPAGSYLACAWVMQSGSSPNPVVVADSKVVNVRIPHLTLTLGVPATVNQSQTFQVATTVQAETARFLSFYALPDTGRGCPANAVAASSADGVIGVVLGRSVVGGPTAFSTNLTLEKPGVWLVCGYIQHRSAGDPPQAASSASLTVLAPPQPCVVPAVVKDEPLAATKTRLAAASCRVGKVHYVASARYARGSVFKVSPVAGTSLANAAAVDLYVSSGAPCIVPAIPRSRSLTSVKRRLTAAGCTVGKVTHRRSRSVRRGRVVTLTAAKGQRLAPRSKVGVVVSSGRGR
ncbi:MAG TPA: hypothetical protein VNT55_11930 [Baekduia sp.]|nr:hypothetical protein [Baekduia sp.]